MSGFRIIPDLNVLNHVAGAFYKDIDLNHLQEIHISRSNENDIISAMTGLYPELQIFYYPSKLFGLMETDPSSGEPQITMSTCIRILRQCFRAAGWRVITKQIIRGGSPETIIIIYPKTYVEPTPSSTSIPSSTSTSASAPASTPPPTKPKPKPRKRNPTGMYV